MAVSVARAGGEVATLTTLSLKSLKASGDLADFTFALKNVDPKVLKSIPADDLSDLLKGIDDVELAKIGKNLPADFVKTLDPSLAKKLKPGVIKKVGTAVTNITRRTFKIVGGTLGAMRKSFPELLEGAKKVTFRPIKNADGTPKLGPNGKPMTEITVEGTQAGKHVKKVSEVEMTPEQVKKLKDVDELVENVPAAREGLMKTGMYVAGGTAFLMLMYDTLNPFEAIKKAVDDTGEVVQGLKEVADEAAEAAKDVTKGGFDLVSFAANNSWLSSLSSVLCLILVFALVAMSFLGGKNK
jgi:hypothetical protein